MVKHTNSTNEQPQGRSSSLSRVIHMKELTVLLGLARSTIYDKLNPKSKRYDPSFPKKLKLGASSVGWLEEDIKTWLLALK